MAQDLKISQLNNLAINAENAALAIDLLAVSGKYMVPAYISEDGSNKRIDIGLLFRVIKSYIQVAALEAIQNLIAAGNLGGGTTGGGTTGGGGTAGENNVDVTSALNNLQAQINAINSQSYPVTYIKLTDGTKDSMYQIVTGPGQVTPYTVNNPIEIQVSNGIVLDNFFVLITISSYDRGNGGTVTVNLSVNISAVGYEGGPIGEVITYATLHTSYGDFGNSKLETYEDNLLNNSKIIEDLDVVCYNVPNNALINSIEATCSIAGVNLGSSAFFTGSTSVLGQGTIKIPTNGS